MLEILDNGLVVQNDVFSHLWFCLRDANQQQCFRAITLRELTALVIDDQELADYNVLGKQWGAMRGVYGAGVDYVYTAAGIFTPEHIGVVQFYGAAGDGDSLDEAVHRAHTHLGAVEATLSNFPQSQTRPPLTRWMEWYLEFVTQRAQNVVAILGQPDPREARGGLGKDGALATDENGDLALEQNELLFRGLAKLREDFVFQVTANHLSAPDLTRRLLRISGLTSNVASRRRGSLSIGMSLSLPLAAALSNSVSGGHNATGSQTHNVSEGISHAQGTNHTDSYSHGTQSSWSIAESEQHGIAVTHSDTASIAKSQTHSTGTSDTQSQSHTVSHGTGTNDSVAHSSSTTQSHSVANSSGGAQSSSSNWSAGGSSSWGQGTSTNQSTSQGSSETNTTGTGTSTSQSNGTSTGQSSSHAQSENWAEGSNWGVNGSVNGGVNGSVGIPGVASVGANGGATVGGNYGQNSSTGGGTSTGETSSTGTNSSTSTGTSTNQSTSQGTNTSTSQGSGTSQNIGGSSSWGSGGSSSSSSSWGTTVTNGSAVSNGTTITHGTSENWGTADMEGTSHGTNESEAIGLTTSVGSADSITESYMEGKTKSYGGGTSEGWGTANGISDQWAQTYGQGDAWGQAVGRSGAQGFTGGFSAGLVPGINVNRSWQLEDHQADRLAEVLNQLQGQLNQAAFEGGFLTEAVLLTASERAATAGEALAPQAFHGPLSMPTPILTVRPQAIEADDLRKHALAFVTHPMTDPDDPFDALGGKYSTLLTTKQVAAYTAPAVFREGTLRVLSAIPKAMGFYPDMPGDVLLGHQYSPETADLTTAKVTLDKARLMHTLFTGATGFGKSVAAMRLVYEVVLHWQMRVVVLDFGFAWRQLLNAPGLAGKVDIQQLNPHGVRPLRWNPLQVSRYINPEEQMKAFVDIFGMVAQLGQKQQQHRLLQCLEVIYLRAGVLVDDPRVRRDPHWSLVASQEEAARVEQPVGTSLRALNPAQRQQISVLRSRQVDLVDLYAEIDAQIKSLPARDQVSRNVLEGLTHRLSSLTSGAAAVQFAKGDDAIDVADLGFSGVLVLEGGKFLNKFSKALLLGWAGWLLYTDMVKQREMHLISGDAELLLVFEEANVMFAGLDQKDQEGGGGTVSEQYETIFRDSRKYGVRAFLIAQNLSVLPLGVRAACSSVITGYLPDSKDKDVVLAMLAKSEKGFTDEPWRRFLTDMPIGMAIGRLPYTFDRQQMRPFLFQPLMLKGKEPHDEEIATTLGRIAL